MSCHHNPHSQRLCFRPRGAIRCVGIWLKVISVCFFLAMASLLKAADGVPPGQLVFFRSFFAILPIVVFLAWRGELIEGFKTKRPLGHLWRGLIGVCGMGLGFFALTRLPLPEAVAINYAMPLLIVVFGAMFLKRERAALPLVGGGDRA